MDYFMSHACDSIEFSFLSMLFYAFIYFDRPRTGRGDQPTHDAFIMFVGN